jgi:glycosyltransferase involved in cell wall biosynthesis
MIRPQPKLCIVAPWIYPLFHPQSQGHFGGWEVRMASIARGLAQRGSFEVSILVGDHGQPHIEYVENIKLYSWRGRQIWGIPLQTSNNTRAESVLKWLRRPFRASLTAVQFGSYLIEPQMIEIYDEIEADIYTVPGNSQFSGELAYYCKQRAKKYVFLAGSDFDLYPEYKREPEKVDIYGVPFSLKVYAVENAEAHLLQNERQAAMLKQEYGLDGTIIRNPIDINPQYSRSSSPESILWVGKSDERVKRPSLVFELARRLPHLPFVIIMNQGLPDTHAICIEAAQALPNVTLIERVPFEEIERYYAAARLFVNTSAFEGFPNTFLQAAKYGVPIIATDIDPGEMLSRHGCGITCGGDFEHLVEGAQRLLTDNDLYTTTSAAALHYVRTYHDKDIVIEQYERAFRKVLTH